MRFPTAIDIAFFFAIVSVCSALVAGCDSTEESTEVVMYVKCYSGGVLIYEDAIHEDQDPYLTESGRFTYDSLEAPGRTARITGDCVALPKAEGTPELLPSQ